MAKRKVRGKKRAGHGKGTETAPQSEDIPATPETRRKRRFDPLGWLFRNGKLSAAQLSAATAIRRGFESITFAARMRISNPSGLPCGLSLGQGPGVGEADWAIDLQSGYLEWAEAMDAEGLQLGPVLDVIVEGMSCAEIDRQRRWRHGTAKRDLLQALDLFLKLRQERQPRVAA